MLQAVFTALIHNYMLMQDRLIAVALQRALNAVTNPNEIMRRKRRIEPQLITSCHECCNMTSLAYKMFYVGPSPRAHMHATRPHTKGAPPAGGRGAAGPAGGLPLGAGPTDGVPNLSFSSLDRALPSSTAPVPPHLGGWVRRLRGGRASPRGGIFKCQLYSHVNEAGEIHRGRRWAEGF